MAELLPNWTILRNPHNWFLVAFSLAILALVSHILFKDEM